MKKLFLMFALSTLWVGNVHASIITFGFEVSNFTPFTGVNNTDVLSGQFSFDSTVEPQGNIFPAITAFEYSSPFISGEGTSGGLAVFSFPSHQEYAINFPGFVFTFAFPFGTLQDNTLPLLPPDISQTLTNTTLNGRVLALRLEDPLTNQFSSVLGEVGSLTHISTVDPTPLPNPTTVSEPAPLALLGLGLLGLGLSRKRLIIK